MRDLPHVPLSAAAAAVPARRSEVEASAPIGEVAFDSRRRRSGALFFCVRGATRRWARFRARRRSDRERRRSSSSGGSTSTWPRSWSRRFGRRWGPISAVVLGEPARSMTIVGVTGTNGKTTIVHLLDAVFRAAGHRTGAIGTVGAHVAGEPVPIARTTPEAPDLHRLLRRMRDAGVTMVAMEVSSHALDQGRVGGLRFDAAIFTNLSQDHLDHHGSMESYFAAKASLFTEDRANHAVVNLDDAWGRRLLDVPCPSRPSDSTRRRRARGGCSNGTGRPRVPGGRQRGHEPAPGRVQRVELPRGHRLLAGWSASTPTTRSEGWRTPVRYPAAWSRWKPGRDSWWWWITRTRRIASEQCLPRHARWRRAG